MAAVTPSRPTSLVSAMSSSTARRTPLANNPNIANSPLRGQVQTKLKRPFATVQREEQYGHPPPKKQIVDHGAQRPVQSRAVQSANAHRASTSRDRVARTQQQESRQQSAAAAEANLDEWRRYHKSRFPKMVFYLESIPPEIHVKLVSRITRLGAREEKFFSIDVTHVVTTRPIPQPVQKQEPQQEPEQSEAGQTNDEPVQTINPSLLDRSAETRRRMIFELGGRRHQAQPSQDDTVRRTSAKGTRNNDVLCKARDMGKKIWSLEKLTKMLNTLLDVESHASHAGGSSRSASVRNTGKTADENDLRQMLRREQLTGPSDRTGEYRDLLMPKGFYLYVFDMEEKQKVMMLREYAKVSRWMEGDWPQFRSVTNGRCPFVEEEPSERKPRAQKERVAEGAPPLRQTEASTTKIEPRKRSLADLTEDGQNRARAGANIRSHLLEPTKSSVSRQIDFRPFTGGRAVHVRQVAGEPVASGMQPSNLTSAIRSQMISSTSGVTGVKAGTSKEVFDLQRKVLQKAAPSQNVTSMDAPSSKLSVLERSRTADIIDETGRKEAKEAKAVAGLKRTHSAPQQQQRVKREPKPGYCENCADKFRDFDEHIMSRKHRRFADNDSNFVELDDLLHELKRYPKL